MTAANRRSLAIAVALAMTAAATLAITPERRLADARPRVDLAALVPAQFDGWREVHDGAGVQPDASTRAKVGRTYDQVLARTYADRDDRRVMLSIAYGGDQGSDRLQAHRPEYCYAAQGFDVRRLRDDELATAGRKLPVRRLVAQRAGRHEPISYWITVGDRAVLPGLGRKIEQLRLGLAGTIPDGMLVRVSSLDADTAGAHALQDRFIGSLEAALRPEARTRLLGAS